MASNEETSTTVLTTTEGITNTTAANLTTFISTIISTTELITTTTTNTTKPECADGEQCRTCLYMVHLLANTPQIIGTCLGAIFIIILFLLYLYEERRKSKNFYYNNKNPPENEQEKNNRDAIAFGTNNNTSFVVEHSNCRTPNDPGGGFKVLEKRVKTKIATAPPITPFSVQNGKIVSKVRTAKKEEQAMCQIQIVADNLGRGAELVALINDIEVPVSCTTPEEKANHALDLIRNQLEKMTEKKFVLYRCSDDKQWVFYGAENTFGEFTELRLELKLLMTSPVNLQINAFAVKTTNENHANIFAPNIPQPPRAQDIPLTVPAVKENDKAILSSKSNRNMKSPKETDAPLIQTENKSGEMRKAISNTNINKKTGRKSREVIEKDTSSKKKKEAKNVTTTTTAVVKETQPTVARVVMSGEEKTTAHVVKNPAPRVTPIPRSRSSSAKRPEKAVSFTQVKKKLKEIASAPQKKEENTQQTTTNVKTLAEKVIPD